MFNSRIAFSGNYAQTHTHTLKLRKEIDKYTYLSCSDKESPDLQIFTDRAVASLTELNAGQFDRYDGPSAKNTGRIAWLLPFLICTQICEFGSHVC